jgi:hypothetical protein
VVNGSESTCRGLKKEKKIQIDKKRKTDKRKTIMKEGASKIE